MRCIGTDADNIRPAQRALQMFKNTKILDLFVGSAAGDEGGSVAMKEKAPSNESPEVLLEKALEEAVEVVDTLCVLLPALYRGGAQSWNPTVNKMTGLALKNLQVGRYYIVLKLS